MKLSKTIFAIILLCPIVTALSQSFTDFIVIDEIAENYAGLQAEFGNQSNVFWTDGTALDAIEQIANATRGLQIENLHIYVATKPGAIVFNSIAITSSSLTDIEEKLQAWSTIVSKKVIIYSELVFTGDEGALLKQSLETITGLVFTTQN